MSQDCRCKEETYLLTENLKYLSTKEQLLKKKYQQLLIENLQKDIIIRELKKKIELKECSGFIGELSTQCASELKKIGNTKRDDSAFVGSILNDFYDKETLKKKTLSGRSKDSSKTPFSPEKIQVLEKLFEKRLKTVEEEKKERETRRNCLSKLIRNAIDSAAKQ